MAGLDMKGIKPDTTGHVYSSTLHALHVGRHNSMGLLDDGEEKDQ